VVVKRIAFVGFFIAALGALALAQVGEDQELGAPSAGVGATIGALDYPGSDEVIEPGFFHSFKSGGQGQEGNYIFHGASLTPFIFKMEYSFRSSMDEWYDDTWYVRQNWGSTYQESHSFADTLIEKCWHRDEVIVRVSVDYGSGPEVALLDTFLIDHPRESSPITHDGDFRAFFCTINIDSLNEFMTDRQIAQEYDVGIVNSVMINTARIDTFQLYNPDFITILNIRFYAINRDTIGRGADTPYELRCDRLQDTRFCLLDMAGDTCTVAFNPTKLKFTNPTAFYASGGDTFYAWKIMADALADYFNHHINGRKANIWIWNDWISNIRWPGVDLGQGSYGSASTRRDSVDVDNQGDVGQYYDGDFDMGGGSTGRSSYEHYLLCCRNYAARFYAQTGIPILMNGGFGTYWDKIRDWPEGFVDQQEVIGGVMQENAMTGRSGAEYISALTMPFSMQDLRDIRDWTFGQSDGDVVGIPYFYTDYGDSLYNNRLEGLALGPQLWCSWQTYSEKYPLTRDKWPQKTWTTLNIGTPTSDPVWEENYWGNIVVPYTGGYVEFQWKTDDTRWSMDNTVEADSCKWAWRVYDHETGSFTRSRFWNLLPDYANCEWVFGRGTPGSASYTFWQWNPLTYDVCVIDNVDEAEIDAGHPNGDTQYSGSHTAWRHWRRYRDDLDNNNHVSDGDFGTDGVGITVSGSTLPSLTGNGSCYILKMGVSALKNRTIKEARLYMKTYGATETFDGAAGDTLIVMPLTASGWEDFELDGRFATYNDPATNDDDVDEWPGDIDWSDCTWLELGDPDDRDYNFSSSVNGWLYTDVTNVVTALVAADCEYMALFITGTNDGNPNNFIFYSLGAGSSSLYLWAETEEGGVAADPEIQGSIGTFAHGESYILNGANFGTKSPAAPYLWAPFDADENPSSLGQKTAWTSTGSMNWSSGMGATGGGLWTTPNPFTKFFLANCFISDAAQIWNAYDEQCYLFIKTRKNFDYTAYGSPQGECSAEWRSFRMLHGGSGDCSFSFYSNQDGSALDYVTNCCLPNTGTQLTGANAIGPTDEWFFFQVMMQNNSTDTAWEGTVGDGTFTGGVNGASVGTVTTHKMRDVNTPAADDLTQIYPVYGYSGNCADPPGGNPQFTQNDTIQFDDVYLDNTWARVMLGNADTYAACTELDPQIPSAWADGSITFTVNTGQYSISDQAYLYVVTAAGEVSNAYTVTIIAP
jgi:hypothetical protein